MFDSLQSTIGGAHEDFDLIVYSSIQSSLNLMFNASSKHVASSDGLRVQCFFASQSLHNKKKFKKNPAM
jgi:hypothetical protein